MLFLELSNNILFTNILDIYSVREFEREEIMTLTIATTGVHVLIPTQHCTVYVYDVLFAV